MKFELKVEGKTVFLCGYMNERLDKSALRAEFEKAAVVAGQSDNIIGIDCKEFNGANSQGLNLWFNGLKGIGAILQYDNCSYWLVSQMNLLDEFFDKEFFPKGVLVKTILVPFYNEVDDVLITRPLVVGKDIPVGKDFASLLLTQQHENAKYEPAFEAEEFLRFVRKMAVP